MPSLLASDPKDDSHNQCPVCGSAEFDLQSRGGDSRFVSQSCPVCGLTCRVVLGPESRPVQVQVAEWAAVFVRD
jgi:transcription elongation factor Elf1